MTVAIKELSSFAALLPKQVFPVSTSEIVRNRFVAGREAAENERDKSTSMRKDENDGDNEKGSHLPGFLRRPFVFDSGADYG
jgi:hypothetical protein